MKNLQEKLQTIRTEAPNRKIRIMIIGLGSVGNYLLDYLMSSGNENIEITVVGRNMEKMTSDVNIVRVASSIRGQNRTNVTVVPDIDLENVDSITKCLMDHRPDMIVNTSRAYPGLKYGSISWGSVRAYGIWAPLSIRFVKNIMTAYENAESNAVVINTSYSDAVIPWLRSAGMSYPDLGSGNVNHLIPRMRFAISEELGIRDHWNIDLTYATSHFHDVVISKEGQAEGVPQLFTASYKGKRLDIDQEKIFQRCRISMPTDAKRNMMNASSNYEIIMGMLSAVIEKKKVKIHSPGAFGEIGGYPVMIDGTGPVMKACIDGSVFSLEQMRESNRESIYLDGIEDVKDGVLTYTDELISKVRDAFGVSIPKCVPFSDIERTADILIERIIEKVRP